MKPLVIIPAFNEAANIVQTIEGLRVAAPETDVLVVDDASSDATAELAAAAGVDVVSLACNLGYGAAVQTGFRYAVAHGYEVAIQMDADGQHDPASLPALLEPVRRGDVDVTLGSRFLGRAEYPISWPRRVGMRLFAALASCVLGRKITDPTTGFQALSRPVMRYFAEDNYPSDYPDADAIILLAFRGFRVREVPVVMKPRVAGASMHRGLTTVRYVLKMFLSIFVIVLREHAVRPAVARGR